jgi:hypothetical protein
MRSPSRGWVERPVPVPTKEKCPLYVANRVDLGVASRDNLASEREEGTEDNEEEFAVIIGDRS